MRFNIKRMNVLAVALEKQNRSQNGKKSKEYLQFSK